MSMMRGRASGGLAIYERGSRNLGSCLGRQKTVKEGPWGLLDWSNRGTAERRERNEGRGGGVGSRRRGR